MYATVPTRGLLKSKDGGASWNPVSKNDQIRKPAVLATERQRDAEAASQTHVGANPKDIVIDPTTSDTLYLISGKGILKTDDGGENWCILDLGIENAETIYNLAIDPRDHNTLYAGTYFGLFKSLDKGCTWKRIEIHKRLIKEEK